MSRRSFSPVVRRLLHQGRSALDAYSIRMSLGLVLSLTLLVGLTELPLHRSSKFVGWGPGTPQDRIQLGELRTADAPDEPSLDHSQSSDVPATVHRARRPEPTEPAPSPPEDTPQHEEDDDASESDSRPMYASQLAIQGPGNQRPRIVGGRGSFYLNIEYPEEARRKGIQGRVVLDFVVNTDGHTQDIRIIRSLHPLCDSSSVAALERTRFVPGQRNGQKIPVRMRLPVRFQLVNLTAEKESTDTQSPPSNRRL